MAAVQRNLHGVGFSGLSLSNLDSALAGEVLVNKEIGLYAVCAPSDKAPMSFEYLSHCKEHLTRFIQRCIDENTIGEIFRIQFNDTLADEVKSSNNLFVNEVRINRGSTAPKVLRFSLDMSLIERATMTNKISFEDIQVEIEFGLYRNGYRKNYLIQENVDALNQKAFALNCEEIDTKGETFITDDYAIILNTFAIKAPEKFSNTDHSIILNDVLVAVI